MQEIKITDGYLLHMSGNCHMVNLDSVSEAVASVCTRVRALGDKQNIYVYLVKADDINWIYPDVFEILNYDNLKDEILSAIDAEFPEQGIYALDAYYDLAIFPLYAREDSPNKEDGTIYVTKA